MQNNITTNPDLLRAAALVSPGFFAYTVSEGKWKYKPHIAAIDAALVDTANGKHHRLMVNMPPRHGKSELISKYFPAWFLGTFPDKKIILTSYEASFAESWGRQVRDILNQYGRQYFGISVDPAARSAGSFRIQGHSGGMDCVGAGGPITGKGADIFIIDDPVKNDAEANSPVIRDKVWEWFKSTAFTRLEPDGAIVIIMTRWHEDDLCGRILKEKNDDWYIINLPALAEPNDPIGRKKGMALWKDRFPVEKLNEIKTILGSYWFSALYQQRPSPTGGGIFKRKHFKYFSFDGEYLLLTDRIEKKRISFQKCSIFGTMDLATSMKETSDYTVVIVFALTPDKDVLIMDIIRERFDGADHLNLIKDVQTRWNTLMIGIESVQYQVALVKSALREGLPVKELRPTKDKVSRALPMAARLEAGCVYFRSDAQWLYEFENELLKFPHDKHDDQVDAFAYIAELVQPISGNSPAGAINSRLRKRLAKGF